MHWSENLIPTLKECPDDAEVISHQLMIRAGLIRKLASGTYSYLPLGLRLLRKIETVIREEMDRIGALEILMPAIQPQELWVESERLEAFGEDLIKFTDRHKRVNVMGPTHEEVVTDIARREIQSYKQLPLSLYQIQTKFRDEMRPRSGVIRCREFLMKDAYSFHADAECLDETYEQFREAYKRIFTRLGLETYEVQADPGAMGGSGSQEFVLFSDAGEDKVVRYGTSEKVVAPEIAARKIKGLNLSVKGGKPKYKKVHTPNSSSIESVAQFLKLPAEKLVKAMVYKITDAKKPALKNFVMVLVRGDHDVSEYKLKGKFPTAQPATIDEINALFNGSFGYLGPVDTKISKLIDEDVLLLENFVVGANEKDYHLTGVTTDDLAAHEDPVPVIGDFRKAVPGDTAASGGEPLHFMTAIELGHIFKLGTRYSKTMKGHFLDAKGKERTLLMGCYGIGVSRLLAAMIEQFHDEKGIKWPRDLSPFQVILVTLNSKDEAVVKFSENLYRQLTESGFEVLWDDRDERPGVKLKDAELIGIPLRIVLSPKNLTKGEVEVFDRQKNECTFINQNKVLEKVKSFFQKDC